MTELKSEIERLSDFDLNINITEDSRLKQDLAMDSIDKVELLIELEKEFNRPFPDSLQDETTTIQHLVDFFESEIK